MNHRSSMLHNRIANVAPASPSPSPASANVAFVVIPAAAFAFGRPGAAEFYRLMYDRAYAHVEAVRRRRREYRAARRISLN